jgi:hypothetical protein
LGYFRACQGFPDLTAAGKPLENSRRGIGLVMGLTGVSRAFPAKNILSQFPQLSSGHLQVANQSNPM